MRYVGLERVSHGRFAEFLVAGECGGEGKECPELVGITLLADAEPVIAEQPGDGSFDHPKVFAEFRARFDPLRAMRTAMPRSRTHLRRSTWS